MFICESCGSEYEDKRIRECRDCSSQICEYCENDICFVCQDPEE